MNNIENSIKIKMIKKGFTLAEVLITLVIIGIISAITVPSLIQSTERNEFISGLNKAYSVIKNTLYKLSISSGYPMGDYGYLEEVNFLEEMAKNVNTIKFCEETDECFEGGNEARKYLKGGSTSINTGKALITSDGYLYTYTKLKNASSIYGLSQADKAKTIGRIVVDVNGSRKPNVHGRDTFFFYIVEGKGIIPAGTYDSSDCTKTSYGRTCAAKVLKEKAMNY